MASPEGGLPAATLEEYLQAGAYTELGAYPTYGEICKATMPLDGPTVIAIDGPTNGGKTTLTGQLHSFYTDHNKQVSAVMLDHFLTDRDTRNRLFEEIKHGDLSIADYSQAAWDMDRYHEAMARVRDVIAGNAPPEPLVIRYAYNRTTGKTDHTHMVPLFTGGVVITEGVGLHAYHADVADMHVRVDVGSEAEILGRVLAREEQKPIVTRLDDRYLAWRYNLVDRPHTTYLRAASLAVAEVVINTSDFDDMLVYKR